MIEMGVTDEYYVYLVQMDKYTLGRDMICSDRVTKHPLTFKTRALARKFACKMLKDLPKEYYAKIHSLYPVEVIYHTDKEYITRISDMPKYDRKEIRISPKTGGLREVVRTY